MTKHAPVIAKGWLQAMPGAGLRIYYGCAKCFFGRKSDSFVQGAYEQETALILP